MANRYPGFILLAIALVAILILAVATMAIAREGRDRSHEVVDRAASSLAFAAVLDSDRFVTSRLEMLRVVAQGPMLERDPEDRELSEYLRQVVESSSLVAIRIVTTDGYLRANTDGLSAGPVYIGDLSFVSDVLRTGEAAVGDKATLSQVTGRPTISVAVPVHGSAGDLIRFLSTPIRLDGSLGEDLRFAGLSGLRAVGRVGNVILDDGPIHELNPAPNQALLAARVALPEGLTRDSGITGIPSQLIAWHTSRLTGWTIYFEQPVERSYAAGNTECRTQQWQITGFAAAALVLVVLAAWALQSRASRVRRAEAAVALETKRRELLVASLSHDLNNPMTAIGGYAMLLARPSTSRERAAQYSQALQSEVRRVIRMLATLADATEEARAPGELGEGVCDLVGTIQHLMNDWVASRGRRISLETDTPTLHGRWDSSAIERVVDNLLSNACKYSAEETEVRIRLSCTSAVHSPEAVIEVIDEGIGIPPTELVRIFELFQRASNVGGRSGSGIGLASVKQVVQELGGKVSIQSHEDIGTTVTVRLPLASPALDTSNTPDGNSPGLISIPA